MQNLIRIRLPEGNRQADRQKNCPEIQQTSKSYKVVYTIGDKISRDSFWFRMDFEQGLY
jgi:hypothetical protein